MYAKQKIVGLFVFLLVISIAFAKDWYVGPEGSVQNPGSKDRPFASVFEARDAIRQYRRENRQSTSESHNVFILDGHYQLTESFKLEQIDSGLPQAPITYKAMNQGKVFFSTGKIIPSDLFVPAEDMDNARLKDVARGNVVVADLRETDLAQRFGRGQGDYGDLAWNEHFLQLAQWPNRAYNHIGEVIDMGPTTRWLEAGEKPKPYSYEKPCGGQFTVREQADFAMWKDELARTKDIQFDGFISADWIREANMVARISSSGRFQLLDSTVYGIGGVKYSGSFKNTDREPHMPPNRRIVFKNLLCELDMPGEWYFDRKLKRLYLWPIDVDYKKATIAIPSGTVMVDLRNTAYLNFEGIVFENGGKIAISVVGGDCNRFAGCTVRNMLGRAANVAGGSRNGFLSCDFYNLFTGISMSGGDCKTLKRADNYIENCDFYNFRSTGFGAISLRGCGLIFKNNIYHNIASGITYSGIYIEFTNSEFFDVGWGMGDWNVLYQGASIWCNGNLVENNFFHDMYEGAGIYGITAVRNDDGGSGTTYRSNIFYKTGSGGITFAGPSCHASDNIVLDSLAILRTNKRAVSEAEIAKEYNAIKENYESGKYARGGKTDRIYLAELAVGKKGWEKEPFLSAFPDFAKYMKENPFAQSYSSLIRNYSNQIDTKDPYNVVAIHGSFQLFEGDGGLTQTGKMKVAFPNTFKYDRPLPIDIREDFVDYRSLDFTLRPGFKAAEGFKPCDMAKVGLYADKYRLNPPSQKEYRSEIYEKYKFRQSPSSGFGYNADTARKYYPLQSWLKAENVDYSGYPYLSSMEDMGYIAHSGIRRDVNYKGEPIFIGGKVFTRGLMVCPPESTRQGEIIFDLTIHPKAKKLAATIGIEDFVGNRGSVVFVVMGEKAGEWVELYRSPKMRGSDDGLEIEVDLQEAKKLKLLTTDAGDGINSDHAMWADAKLLE